MTDVLVPGGRDVRGTLETPDGGDPSAGDPIPLVVACPPHPQHGGSRSDPRLAAASEALAGAGIACLRFDYGPWDEGRGELEDARNAVRWARDGDRFAPVGIFGYSFGAALALLAGADLDADAVAALAPPSGLGEGLDALEALGSLESPALIVHGERDATVDWEPVVERARDRGDAVASIAGDHFFLGNHDVIAGEVAEFFGAQLFR